MTNTSATAHRISWFVWTEGQLLRHTSQMRGTWGWDVECSCGWKTHTGGATRGYIKNEVWLHKLLAD